MMKKRLVLSKRLLKPDAPLIVTVDDNELPRLWMLLNEIFSERTITAVTIQHNPGGTQGDQFSITEMNMHCLFLPKTLPSSAKTISMEILTTFDVGEARRVDLRQKHAFILST